MKEIWKEVEGSNGKYKVSNTGKVWSNISNREIGTNPDKHGYHTVSVIYKGKKNYIGIHRLIGFHFLENYEEGNEINHKDANKSNNNASNLEWVTHQQNMTHLSENGLNPRSQWCCVLSEDYKISKIYKSIHDCDRGEGIHYASVYVSCTGNQNSARGKIIRFYNNKTKTYVKTKFDNGDMLLKGKYNKEILCVETGEIFHSQQKASEKLKIDQSSISHILNGKKESANGYHLIYKT